MGSSLDLVASFSHDSTRFAFQASVAQKNNVDIYPLNENKDYVVNSSLVSHIDYETNDMKVSDVIFFGWCSELVDTQSLNAKRKLDEDEEHGESTGLRYENFFVNGFPDGRIVVYSSNGKDIVNIIKNKKQVLGADTDESNIWILDSDKVVKKLQYNNSKPIKTFTLVDGKDDEIIHFQVLHQNGVLLVCIISEQVLYIVDPSKRRPSTKYRFEVVGAVTCEFSPDGKYLLIADLQKLTAYDLTDDSKPVQSWSVQVEKLKFFNDLIFALTTDGKMSIFKISEESKICTINVNQNLEIIDFAPINNMQQVLISWLNVNEPNFEPISLKEITSKELITINEGKESKPDEADQKQPEEDEDENQEENEPEAQDEKEKTETKVNKRVSKSDQAKISNVLLSHLESDSTEILDDLVSESWTEPEIKKFIVTKVNSMEHLSRIFSTISEAITQNPWNEQDLLPLWLKWLLTLKSGDLNSIKDKHTKKNVKHLKSALRSSEEILPVLLGIQGRLEMLRRQVKLREDLVELTMQDQEGEDDEVEVIEHSNVINNPLQDQTSSVGNHEQDSIVYANGESDEFVDASEYKD
ncbi:utp9p [Saccharomyces arboricola H-6]|uniref:Utp9p n=1 Tax=Saccharomyces arboricola (strain H-6 / AS 2.3317 / CBS 10644) TaxID=1160507 RepID=J8Q159_SACAR|nr:utp9p [Saccharomyces arboricola H-6]